MSHVDDGFRSLTLKRFPQTDDVNPLLAWEAADEYLLQQLDETEIRGPVLILNDTFGALSCALAEHSPYSIGDSYLSELGTRENLRHNGIAESSVTFLDSTADYPLAYRAYYLNREAHTTGIVAAPFVIAMVSSPREKFINQIAL